MSPAQNASRLRDIAGQIRLHRLHVVAAELVVRGLDPRREAIPPVEQIAALSELLQDAAQRLAEQAAGLIGAANRKEKAARAPSPTGAMRLPLECVQVTMAFA